MEEREPLLEARKMFQRFVSDYDVPTGQHQRNIPAELRATSYLQEFLLGWLEVGNGVEFTARSYETYLHVALDIADAAMRDEIDFSYKGTEEAGYADAYERKILSIHEPDHTAQHYADRPTYELAVLRWEHRGTGRLTPGTDPAEVRFDTDDR